MKNYNLLSMLVLGMVLFGSLGCAKDQTVAEYDNAQAAKQAAQNLPAVAQWAGPLKGSDGSTVGVIQLNLENQSNPEVANDNTTTQMTVLGGTAELTNVPNSEATVTNGNFQPSSDNSSNGTLSATIAAKDATSNIQSLTLTGTITGNTMTGQIQAIGESSAMTFTATKGASPASQNLVITSKRAQFESAAYFSTQSPVDRTDAFCSTFMTSPAPPACLGGSANCSTTPADPVLRTTTSPAQCMSNIQMAVIESNQNGEVNFFNVFTDQPTVQVDFTYYNSFSFQPAQAAADNLLPTTYLQLPAVTWDLDSNKLSGTNSTAIGTNRLDCSGSGPGWSCTITNGGAVFSVTLVPGQLNTHSQNTISH